MNLHSMNRWRSETYKFFIIPLLLRLLIVAHFTFAIASYTAVIGHNLLVLDLLYLVHNSLSLYITTLQSASNHHAFWLKPERELSQITRWYDLSYAQGAYMPLPYHEEHEAKSEIEKEETKKAATFLPQPYIGSRI